MEIICPFISLMIFDASFDEYLDVNLVRDLLIIIIVVDADAVLDDVCVDLDVYGDDNY